MRLRALVRCYVGRAKGICQVSGGVCERATAAPLSSCARPPTHAGARPARELLSHRPARELLSAVLRAVPHLGASPSASAARATRASVGARGCLARRPTSVPPPGGFPPTFCELMETWRSSKVKRGLLDATPPPPLCRGHSMTRPVLYYLWSFTCVQSLRFKYTPPPMRIRIFITRIRIALTVS